MPRPVLRLSRQSLAPNSRVGWARPLRSLIGAAQAGHAAIGSVDAHSPPTPPGQMGEVGAVLRGRLEEDPACEEGAGAVQGPESGELRDQEERRDAGPGLGYQGCGVEMENQNQD